MQLADQAAGLKTAYIAMTLALPMVVFAQNHPAVLAGLGQQSISPVEVGRIDGSLHSSEPIGAVLARAAALPGAGLGEYVLLSTAMFGAVRLGDDLKLAQIDDAGQPLLQFARHLRNACAHGNRWHFRGVEPREPAELRGRALTPRLHGTQALNVWLGPGDFCDFLDDVADHLRRI